MKPTKQNVRRVAARLGASIDWLCESFMCDAPPGKIWNSSGCHVIACYYMPGFVTDAYAYALSEMGEGVTDCDIDDCEVCADNPVS